MVSAHGGGCKRDMLYPDLAPHTGRQMRKRWPPEHGMLSRAGEMMPPEKHGLLAIRLDLREEVRTSTTSPPWRAAARKLGVDAKESTP